MYFVRLQLSVEQFQPGTYDLLYRVYDGRKDLIRHNFAWLSGKAALQGLAPCDPQFCIDVDDVDSSRDRFAKVFIFRPRAAV